MRIANRAVYVLAATALVCSSLFAQESSSLSALPAVPRLVNFSGIALDAQGKTISGIAGATFAIYSEQDEGSPLWLETQNIQSDGKGTYTVQLGATKPQGLPLDLFTSGEARWLGVTVNGGQEQPRVLLLSVPYALKAADADTVGGLPASAFVTVGKVGTAAPPPPEQANEIVCSSTTACKTGFLPFFSTNGGSAKVSDSLISQSGTVLTVGGSQTVNGSETINGNDTVTGNESVTGAINAGGEITSPYIVGLATAGDAMYGYTGSGIGITGQSGSGTGMAGYATGDPVYSYGVYGENDNTSGGRGVYGYNPSGASGIGVQGYAPGTNAIGVAGSSNTFGSTAHIFIGNAPMGVIGDSIGDGIVATSDPGTALVAANNNGSYYAAFFDNMGGGPVFDAQGTGGYVFEDANGNINVSGAVLATVKDFKMDHPLDPANKYLYHASVESSEMKNIYDGLVVLDDGGSATVVLPDWFGALNGDFRYQLTAIGAPGPNLHIAQEISNNQFVIAGGQPGTKVSWQVTGVRHDPYAETHPLQVSVEKPDGERGYYIHPELYGAPEEKGLAAVHRAQLMQKRASNPVRSRSGIAH